MTEYHKINAPFKRDMSKPKHPLIYGDWAMPELGYLSANRWEFTEKVDGTNIRIVVERVDDHVTVKAFGKTDKAQIPTHLLDYLKGNLSDAAVIGGVLWGDKPASELAGTSSIVVLYGEGYGPKIQGGGKYREDASFVLFDVNFAGWWLDRSNVDDIASKLGIDSVPVLGQGSLWDAMDIVRDGIVSKWGDFEAEGIVARPVVPLFDRKGHRIITKIKAVDFR